MIIHYDIYHFNTKVQIVRQFSQLSIIPVQCTSEILLSDRRVRDSNPQCVVLISCFQLFAKQNIDDKFNFKNRAPISLAIAVAVLLLLRTNKAHRQFMDNIYEIHKKFKIIKRRSCKMPQWR
jgi:hypothetical protein